MTGEDDTWMLPAGLSAVKSIPIQVQEYCDVKPLSRIVGASDHAGVPPVLRNVLLPKDHLKEGDDEATMERSLHCYAVLDAALTPNLPEMLEISGLSFRCLYTGVALEESGSSAPWLVELQLDSKFVKRIFTVSDAPWHLWNRNCSFLVSSPFGFDFIWSHLRKLTRVQDQDGSWLYFRFWDRISAQAMYRLAQVNHGSIDGFSSPFNVILLRVGEGKFASITRDSINDTTAVRASELLFSLKPIMVDIKLRNDIANISSQISTNKASILEEKLLEWVHLGFRNPLQLRKIGELEEKSSCRFLERDDVADAIKNFGSSYRSYVNITTYIAGK